MNYEQAKQGAEKEATEKVTKFRKTARIAIFVLVGIVLAFFSTFWIGGYVSGTKSGKQLYESAFPMAKNNDWRGFGVEVTKTSMIFPYQGIVRPVYRMLPESGTFAVFCVYADGRKILTDVQANFDGHTGYLCPELKDVTPSHQIFVRKTEKMVFGYYSYVEVQN